MHWDCQGRWEELLGQKASLLRARGHLCIMGTFFLYEDSQALWDTLHYGDMMTLMPVIDWNVPMSTHSCTVQKRV